MITVSYALKTTHALNKAVFHIILLMINMVIPCIKMPSVRDNQKAYQCVYKIENSAVEALILNNDSFDSTTFSGKYHVRQLFGFWG